MTLLSPGTHHQQEQFAPGLQQAEDGRAEEHDLVIRVSRYQQYSGHSASRSPGGCAVELTDEEVECQTEGEDSDEDQGELLHDD